MKDKQTTSLSNLFFSFAKIGLFTFGGGMAMLPMLERECVNRRKWTTEEEMLNYYAISQCTPGIIAVNTATFIGHKQRGVVGGIVATLGVVFPSFVIILFLASILLKYSDNIYLLKAFAGIRVAVCSLLTVSVVNLSKKADTNILYDLFTIVSLVVLLLFNISPVIIVLFTILFGLIKYFWEKKK